MPALVPRSEDSGRLPVSPARGSAAPLWAELPGRKTALAASPSPGAWELSTNRGGQWGIWSWSPAGADQSDTESLVAAATQPRGRNQCPHFAFYFHGQNAGGMLSTHCRLGRKVRCSLCLTFLLSCCFMSWQLVTGRWVLWAALPLHLEGCLWLQCQEKDPDAGKNFFMIHLSKVICKLWKKALVNAVLLMPFAKLHVKHQHSWFSSFCALWCSGTAWILGGLWENLSAQSPSNTHMNCGIAKEELLVYGGDFSCFPAAEQE